MKYNEEKERKAKWDAKQKELASIEEAKKREAEKGLSFLLCYTSLNLLPRICCTEDASDKGTLLVYHRFVIYDVDCMKIIAIIFICLSNVELYFIIYEKLLTYKKISNCFSPFRLLLEIQMKVTKSILQVCLQCF